MPWGVQQPDPAARLLERPQGGRFSTASVSDQREREATQSGP